MAQLVRRSRDVLGIEVIVESTAHRRLVEAVQQRKPHKNFQAGKKMATLLLYIMTIDGVGSGILAIFQRSGQPAALSSSTSSHQGSPGTGTVLGDNVRG